MGLPWRINSWPCLALLLCVVLHLLLSHLFLHFPHLDSILGVCLPLLFSKVPSSSSVPHPHSPSCCTIYHSLPPSHLSLLPLPSPRLSLLRFSSGSPLIKPLCPWPPCPVSTHTSHRSPPPLFLLLSFIALLLSLFIFLSHLKWCIWIKLEIDLLIPSDVAGCHHFGIKHLVFIKYVFNPSFFGP